VPVLGTDLRETGERAGSEPSYVRGLSGGRAAALDESPEADMARLLYSAITSLDGYVADGDGNFDWSVPDEQVHADVNDLMRAVGTQLCGRRLYEVMLAWETLDTTDEPAVTRDFAAIWRDSDKVVYSTELEAVSSERTRIERDFDPSAVRAMKTAAERDLLVGGPDLAGQALRAGLVDELHLFVSPVIVGGGTRALPDHLRLDLELVDERRFANGVVHLHYRLTG
jgi:dihydrofolate reductase